ncbi:MAG: hypothetical protein K2L44_06335, partial [Duncaniella sp.]|nr:hypothetical protein [Duncaniella sp.]
MAKSKIGIVIEREYLERVKKKSFIFTTLLMPLLMLLLMALPALLVAFVDKSETTVLVVDNSKRVAPLLENSDEVKFEIAGDITVDSALRRTDVGAVLIVPVNVFDAKRAILKLCPSG